MRKFRHHAGGIEWYCEEAGEGPSVVLIPSGEGDCGSFEKTMAILSERFHVITFDMPGFSRTSDPLSWESYSVTQGAAEIADLVRSLGLAQATMYGCSSGGQFALALAADHPELVRNIVIHEVAMTASPMVAQLTSLDDAGIAAACRDIFRNLINEDATAWDDLGADYHSRLERNYVTWVRRYFASGFLRSFTPEELRRKPVTWTIGGLTPAVAFFDNVLAARAADLEIGLLMCRHFPQVSIPEVLAEHIASAASLHHRTD